MPLGEVIRRSRTAVEAGAIDPAAHGLTPLPGGMSHDVFAPVEDPSLVVKAFRASAGDEPQREWDALVALAGSAIAPEPVHFDGGDPPIVVMTRVPGSSLTAGELDADHARTIGDIHRRIHQTRVPSRRRQTDSGLQWTRAALTAAPAPRDPAPEVVARAWSAARAWIECPDAERALLSDRRCFTRGDPNLSNYLWSDDGLVLVDWENSGEGDPALELADMAEHASTRALDAGFWDDLAEATELTHADRSRVPAARRLMACFWLVLIERRQREGLPTTVTVDEQALRTLTTLETLGR